MLVAFTCVAPVKHEYVSIGAHRNLKASEERILRQQEIGFMSSHISRPVPFQLFDVGSTTVHVEREQLILVASRPMTALVDHHSDVSMAPAKVVRLATTTARPPSFDIKMIVVRDRIDSLEYSRVHAFSEGLLEMRAGNRMPDMSDHGVDEEQLTVHIPIVSPGIHRTVT